MIFFILASVGLTYILVDGSIFRSLRNWLVSTPEGTIWNFFGKIINCHQCCGTWAGWLMGWLFFSHWYEWIGAGFITSLLAMTLNYILVWLDSTARKALQ